MESTYLLCPWDFPGKNTGVGCHFLLQGIFATHGLNPLAEGLFTTEPCGKGFHLYEVSKIVRFIELQWDVGGQELQRGWNGELIINMQMKSSRDLLYHIVSLVNSDGKESTWNVGDPDLVAGLGRSPGEGNGYPFQKSCLEYSMDRGAWQATVPGVTKSWTRLSD